LPLGYSVPLWVQSVWVESQRSRERTGGAMARPSEAWGAAILRAVACGAAFTAILALRSRTSLDFIYFQS